MDLPQARRARFLRHHRLPAAGRPRHPRRHGRAPGGDGAPCRARKPRGGAARHAAAAEEARAEAGSDAPAAAAAPPTDEISEWAIVAAAFGEDCAGAAPNLPTRTCRARTVSSTARRGAGPRVHRPPSRKSRPRKRWPPKAPTDEPAPMPAEAPTDEAKAEEMSAEAPAAGSKAESQSRRGKEGGPRPLPPGWFRADAADDVAGRLLGARDGQRAARAGLSGPSAVGGARAALCLLGQAALRARARGAARAPAPAADASSASSTAASGPSGRTSGSSSPIRRVLSGARTNAGAMARPGWPAARSGAPNSPPSEGPPARGSAARGSPRAAAAAPRQRRAGAAPLRHHREEGRRRRRFAVRQAARAQARRKEVA